MSKLINIFVEAGEDYRFLLPHNGKELRIVTIPYDELVKRSGTKTARKESKAKVSKSITMLLKAIDTGIWASGHQVDKTKMEQKLTAVLDDVYDFRQLTSKAQAALINSGRITHADIS